LFQNEELRLAMATRLPHSLSRLVCAISRYPTMDLAFRCDGRKQTWLAKNGHKALARRYFKRRQVQLFAIQGEAYLLPPPADADRSRNSFILATLQRKVSRDKPVWTWTQCGHDALLAITCHKYMLKTRLDYVKSIFQTTLLQTIGISSKSILG
jgi:hypothetical protein